MTRCREKDIFFKRQSQEYEAVIGELREVLSEARERVKRLEARVVSLTQQVTDAEHYTSHCEQDSARYKNDAERYKSQYEESEQIQASLHESLRRSTVQVPTCSREICRRAAESFRRRSRGYFHRYEVCAWLGQT